jgi:hypothetical protein
VGGERSGITVRFVSGSICKIEPDTQASVPFIVLSGCCWVKKSGVMQPDGAIMEQTIQGCKLLSDIGQCSHIMHFFAVTKSDNIANSLNLHFAIRHSSILLNIAPEWLYILVS